MYTIIQQIEIGTIYEEINTFTQQGCIKLHKRDSKYIYNVKKVSNKCCSFYWL